MVQICPGLFTLVYIQISPGHIWTTLYNAPMTLPAGNLDEVEPQPGCQPAASSVNYTTSCKHNLELLRMGENYCPKHVELIGIINKPLLLQLIVCLYYCVRDARSCKNQIWLAYSKTGENESEPQPFLMLKICSVNGMWQWLGELTLILWRSRTGTVCFYTSTSNKRAARPKLYTESLTRDLKLMYSRLTLVRISINL